MGPIAYGPTQQTVSAIGAIPIVAGGLTSNHWYHLTAIATNSLGSADTISFSFKTLNVNVPAATVTPTAYDYTNYDVDVFLNPKGSWDSSQLKKVYLYEGASIVDSMTVSFTDTATVSFHEHNKTPNMNYSVKVKVVNVANLSATSATVIVHTTFVAPNQDPHIDDMFADNAATLRVSLISYGASTGNVSNPRLVFKDNQTGIVDTTNIATGLTGTGTILEYVYTNCIGGHTIQVTVIDDNYAGRRVGNTRTQTMPLPDDPILADMVLDSATTTTTTLGIIPFGSGEGNLPTLKLWLYLNNTPIGTVFSTSVNSGSFSYPYSWDNLQPNTRYKVVGELSAPGKQPSTVTRYFWTNDVSTGVEEPVEEVVEKVILSAATIPAKQQSRIWNFSGKLIGEGEFRDIAQQVRETNPIVIISLFNEEKKQWSKPDRLPLMNF